MISDKQLAANRANAQKSTGPTSEAGKKRSSLNAARHGLTGQVVVLPHEDMEAFNAFSAALVATFQPHDAHETQLATCYAGFQWRINRVAAVEDSLFSLGLMEEIAENLNIDNAEVHNAATNAKSFRADSRAFDRLSLYNHRLINGAAKVLKQLQQIQAARRQHEQQQLAEAARLYRYHQMQKTTFAPEAHGFDLTNGEIRLYLDRTNLHNLAQVAENVDFDAVRFQERLTKTAA